MKAGFVLFFLIAVCSCPPSVWAVETCKTAACHAAVGGVNNTHAPVKDGDCSGCHKQTNPVHPLKEGRSFVLTNAGGELCYQCHDRFGKKRTIHPPVKEGECSYCHNPHGGVNRNLLGVGENQTQLCIGCHDAEKFNKKMIHGPVAVGSCTKCHNPHESNDKFLLNGSVWEVCVKCHKDFLAQMQNAPFAHAPVKNGPCTSCHDPHSSANAKLLKAKTPDLCLGCHKAMDKKLKSKIVHKPLTQEGGCSSCHAVHFSKTKKLLETGGITLCLGCHDTDKLGSPPLSNIKKEIEGKKILHGPIARGECQACHDPHGNDNFRLLKGPYPSALYLPYKEKAYDFCLSCHEKSLLKFAETSIYTKFRNGKRNLHYVHVVNAKGRTCRICHEPHASNGEKLLRTEGAAFGDWKIPLNFKSTPTGGSCAPGCHRAFKYDRNKPEP